MRLALSTVALVACTSLASAADLGGPYGYDGSIKDGPVAASYNWTGLYVGGHVGYGWSDFGMSVNDGFNVPTVFPGTDTLSADGWLGGLQAGAQYQHGPWVLGLEADVSWADMDGDGFFATQKYIDSNGTDGTLWSESVSLERFGTVRGRIGYAFGPALLYATGGWAWASVDVRHLVADGANPPHAASSMNDVLSGYAVGGGIEWALNGNWSVKGEYLYLDFGREKFAHNIGNNGGEPDIVSSDLEIHSLRLGVNYKFGH